MRWDVYKKELLQDSYDVIVVGSGIGSLTTAAILARAGKKVLVLEKHYEIGGFTHSFTHKGYEWNTGIHYIGQVGDGEEGFRQILDYITEKKLKWADMGDVYDRFFFPDRSYSFYKGMDRFIANLSLDFPGEEKNIQEYVNELLIASKARNTFFLQKIIPSPISKLTYPVLSKKFSSYTQQTTLQFIQKYTSNEKLIGVLTGQWGDYGLTPDKSSFGIHALVASHYLEGGYYPVGGSRNIAKYIVEVIKKYEGQVFIKAEVDEILLRKNKAIGVKLANGDEITAPLVVSGIGVVNTFAKTHHKKVDTKKILKNVSGSFSYIELFVGFKESNEALGLPKNNCWIYPGYDHGQNVKSYLDNPETEFPVVYISFPSAKDPEWSARYPGKSTIEIISFAPFEWFSKWENTKWHKRGQEYEDYKEYFAQRLLHKLYELFPHLKNKVDYYELSTPLSTKHFTSYNQGEMYGLEHTPERFSLANLKPQTPIKNLFLTGQDVVSNGMAGATFSGMLTSCAILRKNVLNTITKELKEE